MEYSTKMEHINHRLIDAYLLENPEKSGTEMKKIQHAKNIIPKNIRIGETWFTVFSITGGSIDKTHMNCDNFFWSIWS